MKSLFAFALLLVSTILLFSCNFEESSLKTEVKTEASLKKVFAQKANSNEVLVFYNVENLFDTINDPETQDDDYLPNGDLFWNSKRYWKKIKNLSKVIKSINSSPAIIGLAEIENKGVLRDLAKSLGEDYLCITKDSRDKRGIDVGIIYNSTLFKSDYHEAIVVDYRHEGSRKNIRTRDILYVSGKLGNEEIHLFVNHWPSRREGKERTEPKRLYAAQKLRQKVDNVFNKDSEAKILIMGDFNDYPSDKSISQILVPSPGKENNMKLINLAPTGDGLIQGSYNYKGDWGFLDQMLVSKAWLNGKSGGARINGKKLKVFKEQWMLFKHPKSKDWLPNRTYSGPRYHGGYSDHLPIYLDIILEH